MIDIKQRRGQNGKGLTVPLDSQADSSKILACRLT